MENFFVEPLRFFTEAALMAACFQLFSSLMGDDGVAASAKSALGLFYVSALAQQAALLLGVSI